MSTVVDIEVWTRKRVTAGDTITRYTLIYVEDGKEYRVATCETEFEARRFARAHHWTVGRVFEEGSDSDEQWTRDHPDGEVSAEEDEAIAQYAAEACREEGH